MPGLSEVYASDAAATVDRRRAAGAALLVAGLALALAAGVAFVAGGATAGEGMLAGGGATDGGTTADGPAPWVAGALASVALPTALLGVLVALPAGDRTLAAGVVGAGVAALGAGLLVETRPAGWQAALGVAGGVYALGVATTLACATVAAVRREEWSSDAAAGAATATPADGASAGPGPADDAPGAAAPTGDARATAAGSGDAADGEWTGGWDAAAERVDSRTRRDSDGVPAADGRATSGAGATDDGSVVVTNGAGATGDGSSGATSGVGAAGDGRNVVTNGAGATGDGSSVVTNGAGATSDGGGATAGASSDGSTATGASGIDDDGVVLTDDSDDEAAVPSDAYCGNCAEFRYVRSEGVMRPYCGHHDALMDDMTACEDWRTNQ